MNKNLKVKLHVYSKWETVPHFILKFFGINSDIINEKLHAKHKVLKRQGAETCTPTLF